MLPVIPLVQKILEYRKTGTVIDIGSGYGHHSLFLAEQGFTVTALDTDAASVESLVQAAKEKDLSIDARIGDVRTLEKLESQWDIVICTFVLHFLQTEEVEKAVRNLKAITKMGGLDVIAAHTVENVTEQHRKPHLFEPGELQERYADWEILHYWHGLGKQFVSKRTGETLEKYRVELIAQKQN